MSYGMRAWDAQGNLTFDSTVDLTLFHKTEQFISGNSQVGVSGVTLSYPQFQGKKIMPFLTSPYGDYLPYPAAVLSCRVSYPNGVPTISIFSDNNGNGLPMYDGYLVVMLTGASQ